MDDGISVEVIEIGHDPGLEFGLGGDADVAEHGSRHLGEEAFDEVEPRAVFRREHEGEASLRLSGDPGCGFLGNMGRVVVEDQLDGGFRRVGCIELLEEADELARAVTVLDAGMHAPGEQIDAGQQAQCAMALVFVVPREALVRAGSWRQVGCGVADRLDAGLLVVGDDRDLRSGC